MTDAVDGVGQRHPLEGLLYGQDHLEPLCAERPLDWTEHAHMNEFYGQAATLKRYAGLPLEPPLPFAVEHAIPYDLTEAYDYDLNCGLPMFLAVHEGSAAAYRAGGMPVVHAIGSVHLYAMELFRQLHPETGEWPRRGTIVFPDKSTLLMDTDFDRAAFAQRLTELPAEFQPVVVCIYWRDYVRGTHAPFVDAGLPVVSCGHLRDPDFQWRFHDLCRRFRYSCANDLAGSFALSVLSGCHFFHLPTHGLTQKKYGITTTHDLDPTLQLPEKAACIAASPFPPQSPGAQQVLAHRLAGAAHLRSAEEIRQFHADARKALTGALAPGRIELGQQTDRAALHRLLPIGLDHDGWARTRCTLHLENPQHVAAMRLQLEFILPPEAGQIVEVHVNGRHQQSLSPPPFKTQVLVEMPRDATTCEVLLTSNREVPLIGDQRSRAFRIDAIELLPPAVAPPSVSAPAAQGGSFWRRIARRFKPA